jgi:hypothetical protein
MIAYIVIPVFLLVICAMAGRSLVQNSRKKRKQMAVASTCDRFMRMSRLAIEDADFFNYRYIGLDRRNKKLLLIDHCNREKQELCIPLPEIGESKIIYVKEDEQGINHILLELRNKRTDQRVQFCFFNKEKDPLTELSMLARKAVNWKTRIDIHKHPGNGCAGSEYVL